MVSVCTPTFNRRPFIQMMFHCFLNQDYPHDRMEWIIVDDGTDSIQDLIEKSGIPQIKYFREEKKMSLGQKRNYMHSKAKGNIIVYMDDDDYYPPQRVSHAVTTLMNNKDALCAGSSEIYIYFKHIQKMYKAGPYGPKHATAGTFAFRAELLKQTSYEEHAAIAEEKHFLKNYTIPFVQLDPFKTILVFSHEHNTFDKKRLLDNQHEKYFRECPISVDDFIKNESEIDIKKFFMEDIDILLSEYKPGEPDSKPDVLEQIAKIDEDRKKMKQNESVFTINEEGKPPRNISKEEIINVLNTQINKIKELTKRNGILESLVTQLNNKDKGSDTQESQQAYIDVLLHRINKLETENENLKSRKV
jgi:hypothetical protein